MFSASFQSLERLYKIWILLSHTTKLRLLEQMDVYVYECMRRHGDLQWAV